MTNLSPPPQMMFAPSPSAGINKNLLSASAAVHPASPILVKRDNKLSESSETHDEGEEEEEEKSIIITRRRSPPPSPKTPQKKADISFSFGSLGNSVDHDDDDEEEDKDDVEPQEGEEDESPSCSFGSSPLSPHYSNSPLSSSLCAEKQQQHQQQQQQNGRRRMLLLFSSQLPTVTVWLEGEHPATAVDLGNGNDSVGSFL